MSDFNRRRFIFNLSQLGGGALVMATYGCRPLQEEYNHNFASDDASMVTLSSMRMDGYSSLSRGRRLGSNGVLKAEIIAANKEVTLPYVQDNHGHVFTLTPEHFAKLRRMEPVIAVETTVAQRHYHYVHIDPRNQVPNSESVTMPIDPTTQNDLPAPLYVVISDESPQRLYIAVPKSTSQQKKLEYCRAALEDCQRNQLWQPLQLAWDHQEHHFYSMANDERLLSDEKNLLHVRSVTSESAAKLLRSMELIAVQG